MSCDWDIKCVDCDVEAGIDNANHRMELMQSIVAHAKELHAFLKSAPELDCELHFDGYYVPAKFFAEHGDHRLRPVDEYGHFDTPCSGRFFCAKCQQEFVCEDREHSHWPEHGHSSGVFWHREEPANERRPDHGMQEQR